MISIQRLFFLFNLLALSISCQPYKDIVIDPYAPKFVTYDQTRMYFNNVRASYYNTVSTPQSEKAEDTDVLLYSKSVIDTTQAIVNLHLVNVPKKENTFIMVSPNAYFNGYQIFTVYWKDHIKGVKGEIRYKQGGMADQFLFATEIYNLLNREDVTFEVAFGDKRESFLNTLKERNAFRITMIDYYRLVGLL